MQTEKMNLPRAVCLALDDAMGVDDKIIILGEDIADREGGGVFGATRGLSTKYGIHRVRSTPISEQAILGAAVGASLIGYKPVAEIMLMNFTTIAMDMIVNHAAKLRFMSGGQTSVPIVIRTMAGSGLALGGQHSDYWEAWFAHVPGIKVVAPSTPADAYGLLLASILDPDPVLFIENVAIAGVEGPAPIRNEPIPLGKAKVVIEGTDITLITHSRMVHECVAATHSLRESGISAEVIDLRTISPWDKAAVLSSVAKTGRMIVVHEAVREFGIGGEIASTVSERLFGNLKAPVRRLGGAYCAVPFSRPLEAEYAPTRERIHGAAVEIFSE